MLIIGYYKYKKRGEELKVPHHTNAAAAHDGNLPLFPTLINNKDFLNFLY